MSRPAQRISTLCMLLSHFSSRSIIPYSPLLPIAMARSLALLAALAGAAVAADSTTTLSLLVPFYDVHSLGLVGSIVGANSAVTTFAVGCAPGTPRMSCDVPGPGSLTFLQGPSTWVQLLVHSDGISTYTLDTNCKFDPAQDVATCHNSVSQQDRDGTLQSETATVMTGYSSLMIPVTITAGVEKLSAAPGATAAGINTNSAPTASTQAGTDTTSSPTFTLTPAGTSKGTSAASTPTKSSNAAGPMVTQNAVLAGVAAVVGGAMML
ncbi:Uncharacterized protein TPAR_00998 [Tolypocladium paradoxum]|uniref:GPI anchored protein n=1 Tax=Tolypocladium paradoxum TaxID=94208 RepID=A0A2S4L8R9_9HYPO|nr:Uncharacterized protein TPAR_00998 [Tolypocladium paradoxum]